MERGVHSVFFRHNDGAKISRSREGRFVVGPDDQIEHLEDHHGLIDRLFPEGPAAQHDVRHQRLSDHPYLEVTRRGDHIGDQRSPELPVPDLQPYQPSVPTAGGLTPVFHFTRPGGEVRTLEAQGDALVMDGNPLSPEESRAVLGDVQSGTAQLRYAKKPHSMQVMNKTEEAEAMYLASVENYGAPDELLFPDEADLAAYDKSLRKAESAAPLSLDKDPETKLSNLRALRQREPKPNEVPVKVQLADQHLLHDHGRLAADDVALALGEAIGKVAREHRGEVYRTAHTGYQAFFPGQEEALRFQRGAAEAAGKMPPVGGTHQIGLEFSV